MHIVQFRKNLPLFLQGVLNSYTQVFFSNSRVFSVILLVVSFLSVNGGLGGLTAAAIANLAAWLMGLNTGKIAKGYYGFNSLLVGFGLGVFYKPGTEFFLVLASASLLTLLLTLWFEGVIGKYALPYLSLSFLFGTWFVSLASRQFMSLEISEEGIYMVNEMYAIGGKDMVATYNIFVNLDLAESLRIYFKSLGAIFFQYHLFAGILIAIGLIIHSRIAFLLSLTGFYSAWFYYQFIGADMHELSYSFIGFNYILTAIAIGGFFIIPSWWSFLWVIILTPVISILLTSTQSLFSMFQLSVYSLPFNIVVLMFLYALKFRERSFTKPELVAYQQFSPEKNLYSHANYKARFGRSLYVPFLLPFWGEWTVTQGHTGEFTHQGEWRHAWDFEVADDEGRMFEGDGKSRDDYHAFGKPVIAPADGIVETIVDDIAENEIGKMDLENNWGNTIILKHGEHLYSKLSHLKKGSIRVKPGEQVRLGQMIAHCGNTGRSPVPHIHFQIQETPYIGSRTIEYPISHFILHREDSFELRSYEIPANQDKISNVSRNSTLENAFRFIPGQQLRMKVTPARGEPIDLLWEVRVDALNATCIFCPASNSTAWFRNDGDIHWFTHFEGDRDSLLFKFYLGAYKVMTGYYPQLTVRDAYPVNTFNDRFAALVQDFAAPFYLFSSSEYTLKYLQMEDKVMQTNIRLQSVTTARFFGKIIKSMQVDFLIGSHGITSIIIRENQKVTQIEPLPAS